MVGVTERVWVHGFCVLALNQYLRNCNSIVHADLRNDKPIVDKNCYFVTEEVFIGCYLQWMSGYSGTRKTGINDLSLFIRTLLPSFSLDFQIRLVLFVERREDTKFLVEFLNVRQLVILCATSSVINFTMRLQTL